MSILPRSGRDGYLRLDSPVHADIPFFSWSLSSSKPRATYRTAASNVMPVGTGGPIRESITFTGFNHLNAVLPLGTLSGEIGWYNFPTSKRIYVPFSGLLTQLQFDFRYHQGANPSFAWNAVLLDYSEVESPVQDKSFQERSILPFADEIVCTEPICNKIITITDGTVEDGLLKHVRSASLKFIKQPLDYITAKSYPRLAEGSKPLDYFADLEVEGDFDYWFNKINYSGVGQLADDYRFYYGSGPAEYVLMTKMKVSEVTNINVNVSTGQMISATMRLVPAYA